MSNAPSEARARLAQVFDASEAARFLREVQLRWRGAWEQGRSLAPGEIKGLESRGNASQDWNGVRLIGEEGGSLEYVTQCMFEGRVILGLGPGRAPRLKRSRIRDSALGAAYVEDVGLLSRMWVEDGASLRQAGEISGRRGGRFCLGLPLHPGSETGARRIFLLDGWLPTDCEAMASLPREEQRELALLLEGWLNQAEGGFGFAGTGARVEFTQLVEDCFVGAGAVVRGATALRRCVLAASPESPCRVEEGAFAEESVLEPGAELRSLAQARRSLLLEFSAVERAGHSDHSVIGPNTRVAKGEVTASLLGPFVGFHHQALLIGALWPEGHGNVGYGANVGSNHTGRKPDQEIKPGEGAFFGLGCSIKFPANFEEAPYSLFATGILVPPQKFSFPFSLIAAPKSAPEGAEGMNEARPGWMWSENAYALIRNAYKYLDRNRARHSQPPAPPGSRLPGTFLSAGLFAPRVAGVAAKALLQLRGKTLVKSVLRERDIPGLGENFLRSSRVAEAVSAYEAYLRFALCRALLLHPDPAVLLPEDASRLAAVLGFDSAWSRLDPVPLFSDLLRSVEDSLARDEKRGTAVFEDYASFHDGPDADAVCLRLRKDTESLLEPLRNHPLRR